MLELGLGQVCKLGLGRVCKQVLGQVCKQVLGQVCMLVLELACILVCIGMELACILGIELLRNKRHQRRNLRIRQQNKLQFGYVHRAKALSRNQKLIFLLSFHFDHNHSLSNRLSQPMNMNMRQVHHKMELVLVRSLELDDQPKHWPLREPRGKQSS